MILIWDNGMDYSSHSIDWWQGGASTLFDVVSPWSADEKTPDVPAELFLRVLQYEDARLAKLLADAKKSSPDLAGWHRNIEHKIAETKTRIAVVEGTR